MLLLFNAKTLICDSHLFYMWVTQTWRSRELWQQPWGGTFPETRVISDGAQEEYYSQGQNWDFNDDGRDVEQFLKDTVRLLEQHHDKSGKQFITA